MENENRNGESKAASAAANADTPSCPSCHAALPPGTRFCRMCGYRLGEGVEEYAETRYFDGKIPPVAASAPPKGAPAAPHFQMPHTWGAVAPIKPMAPAKAKGFSVKKFVCAFGPASLGWVFWVILSIVVLTAGGIVIRMVNDGGRAAASMPDAFLGVDGFDDAPGGGGAMIEGIAAPGTPVELAGIIGGDIIISFDGKSIADADDMRRALAATPIGKEVEVKFIRDGQEKTTKLTVGSDRDYRAWADIDARPGGKGQFGVSDFDRVRVPGQDIYGVRIGNIDLNEPADLAGIQENDIVTQFDDAPIRTVGDLRYRIYKAVPGSTVTVIVVRGGGEQVTIPVKVGRSR